MITLQYTSNCFSQPSDSLASKVIISFFKQYAFPYKLSISIAPYEGLSYDFKNILNKPFLEKGLKRGGGYHSDTFFTDCDIVFMKNQIINASLTKELDSNLLRSHTITFLSPAEETEEYKKLSGMVTKITKPLFSMDGGKSILYLEYYCTDGCNSGVIFFNGKAKWEMGSCAQ